jgi:inhibitor of KinA
MGRSALAEAPRLGPLGDQAILAQLPDEEAALSFAAAVRAAVPAWLIDVVQAYTTVAVFFDPDQVRYAAAVSTLRPLLDARPPADAALRCHVIPICYELNLDLERVAAHRSLSAAEVVRLHAATEYVVHAIGFCPGFPYLGYLPDQLCGVPRLDSPRLRVEAGSVGLTGLQTGIYTEARPAGWNIVGRTPLELVHVADAYFPLRTGDRVRFEPVGRGEYHRLLGRRLS